MTRRLATPPLPVLASVSEHDLRTDVVQFSPTFERLMRQDPAGQLGYPTHSLAIIAMSRGAKEDAVTLARYMRQECSVVVESILRDWLGALLEYAIGHLGMSQHRLLLRVPGRHVWESFVHVAESSVLDAVDAIESGQLSTACTHLHSARRVYKTINDELVRFIQDILTALDDAAGEDAPIAAMRGPYEDIWRRRYANWEQLSGLDRLRLSCEGMRAHFGGPTRQGEFEVFEEPDRFIMVFAPCGTGGVLRRGDPETGEGPWPTTGLNRTPKPYTWAKTGVPWYCTHCALYLEHWPAEDVGSPRRPVRYEDDPGSAVTTSWVVMKSAAEIARPMAEPGATTLDDTWRKA